MFQWSNTEDFAKKKEIRVRLYKLRESRLKNYYTSDDTKVSTVNTSSTNIIQETNRKHSAIKTHTDSIQDQGYMSLKSKEIRDSESPTKDIHGKIIRNDSYNNKSYEVKLRDNTVVLPNSEDWTTSQTANYSTKNEGNTVIESAERQSAAVLAKNNENITLNAHEAQTFSSTDNSKDGNIDKSTVLRESADLVQNSSYKDDNTSFQAVSKQKQDTSVSSSVKKVGNVTSYSTSSRTVSSKSSSSKTVTSSSKIISSKNLAIDSGDDFVNKNLSIKENEDDIENLNFENKKTSKVDRTVRKRSSTASIASIQSANLVDESESVQKNQSLTNNFTEYDDKTDHLDSANIRSSKIIENRSDSSSSLRSSKITKNQTESSTNIRSSKVIKDSIDASDFDQSSRIISNDSESNVRKENNIDAKNRTSSSYDHSKFIENEKVSESTKIENVENDTNLSKDRTDATDVKIYNSRKDIKTAHLTNINTSSNVEHKNVDQNIMSELNNLDTYLSTHPTSTPVSPRSAVTDTDYQDSRRTPVKHPSTLDLPKECTDGQYLTTYNDSYKNRISTDYDVSPTHNAFASSLRADTPERSPVSPTRAFSTDRKSPRSSPEKTNTRSVSDNRHRKSPEKTPTRESPKRFSTKSSPERSVRVSPDRYSPRISPERTPTRDTFSRESPNKTPTRLSPSTTRRSPTKSPRDNQYGNYPTNRKSPERTYNNISKDTDATRKVQERKMSSGSYVVETKKETKTKRKFSSAQSKDAAKKRVSTPKVSPDTSPTRGGSDSDNSNDSQGTYNTNYKRTEDVTRSDSHDTYTRSDSHDTYNKSTDYKRSDSSDTFNKYRRDSTDTYSKEIRTQRNDSRNSYTIDTEDSHQFERSDSRDSFNVSKLRKDSKDIAKQELKQRKLFSETDSENERTTRTNDFIRTEISGNSQQNNYKSPSVSPVRQKSPEYSSEGSITREIKLTNSLTDKNLILIEQAEEINVDINQTSSSVTPCTSPDSSQNTPRRPSILKKTSTDSKIVQESHSFNVSRQKSPQQSFVNSRPTSPEKSFIKEQQINQKSTERKSSILKSTSKQENKDTDIKTLDRKASILKGPAKKDKSPERAPGKTSPIFKEDINITVTDRRSPVRDQKSPTRTRKSPSPTGARKSTSPSKSPRQSPTKVVPFESRLTSPTQASLIREQKISETFDLTIKEKSSPTRERGSPEKSPIRDTKSPEKIRKSPTREKASPQRAPPKQVEKRPTRKSSIPRAESLRSINKKTTTPVTPTVAKQPIQKSTPSKTPSQRNLTPQQSRSSIRATPQKVPVTARANSTNVSKSSLVKTNSYTNRRTTEPVKQVRSTTPSGSTRIPTKTTVKQSPVVSKQPLRKLPVKSPKTSKELKVNSTKKQTKSTIEIEKEIRASNRALQDILTKEQQEYDSEIDSEMPPEEFLVDDDETYEQTVSTKVKTQTKSYFTNKQDQIRRGKTTQEESSSDDEENENITITKANRVEENQTNKQNEDLLSVVVQLPNSSRESTPGVKHTGAQPVPAYTADVNQPTRYADYYSEPETDNEKTTKSVESHRRYEQVTDLDEETIDSNVSVADRVDKFLNSTRNDIDKENNQSEIVIEKKSVSQAKNMFENIAKSQSSPNYPEKVAKQHTTPLSSRKPVEEAACETKTYYEISQNHEEKRITNDFINIEKETIRNDEIQTKKSPKDLYLEKTVRSSTPTQKSGTEKTNQKPQKKVFDDTYYIEKNKRKQEEIEKLNQTTINSCDEYIEIKEEIDTKKKSPKDIYLERTQKSVSKTNVTEIRKKSTDKVVDEKKDKEEPLKRTPSNTLNSTNSKKNFFEEKINLETEKSKATLRRNKSGDRIFKSERKSPARQSPSRKSPEKKVGKSPTRHTSPIKKSPVRQSPTRKSPEKIKRKYETRKDSLMEIRGSNIIAERRSKFSPVKEHQSDLVSRRLFKNISLKENIRPTEKSTERKSAERKSSERRSQDRSVTTSTTTRTTSSRITSDTENFSKDRKPSVERAVPRKSSNSKFEERRASFENKSIADRKISSERRISSDKTVVESRKSKSRSPEPKISQDRSSPARKVAKKVSSPDRQTRANQKQDSFSNKFGVALKKTAATTTRTNTTVLKSSNKNAPMDSIFDIESIFDLELLEKMVSLGIRVPIE